jgi:aminoglycoside phosphotransferase (APT) family kinase protein
MKARQQPAKKEIKVWWLARQRLGARSKAPLNCAVWLQALWPEASHTQVWRLGSAHAVGHPVPVVTLAPAVLAARSS